MPLTHEEQQLLGRLLLAMCCVVVRSNPTMRGQLVQVLARDHCNELVDTVVNRLAATEEAR